MRGRCCSYVLVPQVLEQLQLAVGALRKNGGAEGLHDLLDGHGLARELILGRTAVCVSRRWLLWLQSDVTDENKGYHANGLQIGVYESC